MELQPQRRFSLDKVDVDPKILNKILSADGDETLGEWDGNSIDDLVKELDRIEEFSDVNRRMDFRHLPVDSEYKEVV